MVINTLDYSLAKAICDEAGKKGSGICYYPGNGREAHNIGFQDDDASGEDIISYFSDFEGSFDKSRVFFAYLKSGEFPSGIFTNFNDDSSFAKDAKISYSIHGRLNGEFKKSMLKRSLGSAAYVFT